MNTHTFIGVSYYLFPDHVVALDAHAAQVVEQLTSDRVTLQPVLKVLETDSIPGNFGEGLHPLWKNKESTLLVFRYGDTALLTGVCPPQEINSADAAGSCLRDAISRMAQRWGMAFTEAGQMPPYQSARVHLLELDERPGSSRAPHHDKAVRIVYDGATPVERAGVSSGDFFWSIVGNNEYLIVSPKENPWLHHWCFDKAHLFRLLLFHGKADRYFRELSQVGTLEAKRQSGHLDPEQLEAVKRKYSNLKVAVDNFAQEWRRAVRESGTPLEEFFAQTHESWRGQGLRAYEQAKQAVARAEKILAEASQKPMRKKAESGAAPPKSMASRLEVELKIKRSQLAPFDRAAFRKYWKKRFGGEAGEFGRSAQGLSFTWQGAQPEKIILDAEKGLLDKAVAANGGFALFEVRDEHVSHYQYVPEVELTSPSIEAVAPDRLVAEKDKIDVAIMTVTEPERDAVLNFLRPWPGRRTVLMGSLDQITYRFGRFGNYRAAQFESTMSTSGSQGATLTAMRALMDLQPKAFLLLGIAFGVDRQKQRMGDVLVANSIIDYGYVKTGAQKVSYRGEAISCGEILSERFRTYRVDWKLDAGGRRVRVFQGLVLSADNLLNNLAARNKLVKAFPQAQGGEMEGRGAYAVAKQTKAEMILVKAICDWADGHKNDRAQPFAAYAAASLAAHVLGKPGALVALGATDLSPKPKARKGAAKQPSKGVQSTPPDAPSTRRRAGQTSAPMRLSQTSEPVGRSANDEPIGLFYSYSHRDENLRDQLEVHLSLLKRQGLIRSWHDRRITPSRAWEGEINSQMDKAQIILLLVSPDFIASDYIYDVELKRAMERHEKGEARVIPVILRPGDLQDAPFRKLQALPKDAKPVTSWASTDEAFADVARGIRRVVEELRGTNT